MRILTDGTDRVRAQGWWGIRPAVAGVWWSLLLTLPLLAGAQPARPAPPTPQLTIAPLPPTPDGLAPPAADGLKVLRRALALRPDEDLRPTRTETDNLGFTHTRYAQYYRGVRVEHGTVSLHARGGRAESWSGTAPRPAAGLSVQPALAEAAARQRALGAVGARRYQWQNPAEEADLRRRTGDPQASYFPKGELVLVGDFRQAAANRPLVLAWKFDVYAAEPVSRALVYVDAQAGQVVFRDNVIKHANATGTFATRYLGRRTSATDGFAGGYRLRETVHGQGVVTLNCQQSMNKSAAIDFVDNDNNWTAAEHDNAAFDNAALDAHVGAQSTQDYWTNFHGRDSYDNRGSVLYSYVHYGNAVDNAYWDGDAMLYGDGGGFFRPLTAVDVCGHEIGHAVCQTTAALVYQDEPGALNEAFSDIWGACVEHHTDSTKQYWLIGEDIGLTMPFLRSMSNPGSAQQPQPDTYRGTNWYTGAGDFGGVHTNSGVLNFWFYLLSAGGTGTNDNGTSYNVTGIGIRKAARVAYRAESVYMTSTSQYADARQATLQAAVDLFGLGSAEVRAVAEAWRAVGLNGTAPTLATMAPSSGPIGTRVTLTGANLGTVYAITFNGVAVTSATVVSATQVVAVVPAGATTGPVVVTTTQGNVTSAGVFTVTGSGNAPTLLSFTPAAGAPQGATVTLTGTNLTGATAVRFNNTVATFTVNSATQITATVPATATTGPISVVTPGGIATTRLPFRVLPALTTLAPTSGVIGTTVTLTGTSLADALNVKFNGVYATFTVVSATQLTATVPTGATTGPVTVRTPSGTATSPAPFTVTPTLTIASFTPETGPVLTTRITIYGSGFTGTTQVRFNNTAATNFTVASDNELWATVPTGATSGPIRVTSPLGTVSSALPFIVYVPGAPIISGFTPAYGPVGDAVRILGTDFLGATDVRFNGVPATFTVSSSSVILTSVPTGATTGRISVTTPVGMGISSTDFLVVVPPPNDLCTAPNLPTIACGGSVDGDTYGAGSTGDPTGGCGTSIDGGGVFYRLVGNGQSVRLTTCGGQTNYDTKLHVFSGTCGNLTCLTGDDDSSCGTASEVIVNTTVGTQYLVFVSGYANNRGLFTLSANCLVPPVITRFTPTSGPTGSVVSISGSGFMGATNVTFNNVPGLYTVQSDSIIVATVPRAATTGPIRIQTPNGQATSSTNFVVTGAGITSFTPPSGPVGTVVTIYGSNFTGATGVAFNGTAATTFSVSANGQQITATVPRGATTGPISVVTPTSSVVSWSNFTVIPATIDWFSPTQGPVGTAVALSGFGFTGARAVYFNGVPATFTLMSATSINTTVPAGATTGAISVVTAMDSIVSTSSFRVVVPLTNDLCSATVPLLTCGGSLTGSTMGSTSTGDPTGFCGTSVNTSVGGVFYRIIGTGADITVATCGGITNYDSKLFVFSGSCGNYTCVGGDDDGCGGPSTVTFSSAAGTTYLIYVSGYSGQGDFTLSATCVVPPVPPTLLSFTPASGPVGTVVRVRGTNLTTATTVQFNGRSATFNVVADSVLTATVPSGATTGPISVVAPGGTATSAAPFTVVVPAGQPTLLTVSPTRNASNVAANASLSLDFSVPMSTGTASAASLYTYGSFAGRRGGTYAGGGTSTVSFDPTTNFRPGETVWATLTTTATSAAGVALPVPHVARFTVAAGRGTGNFVTAAGGAGIGQMTWEATAVDFDGDGDLDAAGTSYSSNSVNLLRNNGNGTFTAAASLQVGNGPLGITAADLDADGDADLVVCNYTANSVAVLRNTGNGFAPATYVAVAALPDHGTPADVDGDGDLDVLIVHNSNPGLMTVLRNNGSGNLTPVSVPTSGASFSFVAAGDVDNDGDVDAAIASQFDGTVKILANDGTGSFTLMSSLPVGSDTRSVALGDLDNDGDLDLAATAYTSLALMTFRNNGLGSFALSQQLVLSGTGTQAVHLADIDGDRDLDALVGLSGVASLGIYTNDGTGQMAQNQLLGLNNSPYANLAADFDGDGDLDLACATDRGLIMVMQQGNITGVPELPTADHWQLWPNPAHHAVRLSGAPARAALVLLDAVGRQVLTAQTDAAGAATLELSHLPPGVYALRLGDRVRRLVVE